jgi:gluconate kinase
MHRRLIGLCLLGVLVVGCGQKSKADKLYDHFHKSMMDGKMLNAPTKISMRDGFFANRERATVVLDDIAKRYCELTPNGAPKTGMDTVLVSQEIQKLGEEHEKIAFVYFEPIFEFADQSYCADSPRTRFVF